MRYDQFILLRLPELYSVVDCIKERQFSDWLETMKCSTKNVKGGVD